MPGGNQEFKDDFENYEAMHEVEKGDDTSTQKAKVILL